MSLYRLSLKRGTGNRGMGTGNGNGEWESGGCQTGGVKRGIRGISESKRLARVLNRTFRHPILGLYPFVPVTSKLQR